MAADTLLVDRYAASQQEVSIQVEVTVSGRAVVTIDVTVPGLVTQTGHTRVILELHIPQKNYFRRGYLTFGYIRSPA